MIQLNLLGQARPSSRKRSWNPFARAANSIRQKTQAKARQSPAYSTPTFEPPPSARRPSLRMLADEALPDDDGDRLGFKPFADALAGIIDSPRTATPLVMAVNAKWGAGKTTLGNMVRRRLETKSAADGHSPHVTCWFAAWMHDEAPNLSTSLAAEVAQVASASRAFWRRIVAPLSPSLCTVSERRLTRGFKYLGCFVLALFFLTVLALRNGYGLRAAGEMFPDEVKAIISLTGGTYVAGLIVLTAMVLFKILTVVLPVAKSVGEFAKDPKSAAKMASMQEVREELGKLIRQATPKGSKFVIFIDDLDRCRPPRSVDVLEAVNQLLDHEGVVVVFMSDMQVVAKSVEIKYKDLAGLESSMTNRARSRFSTYGWSFLQKIIQLQFDLPIYSVESIQRMVADLAIQVPEEKRLGWVLTFWSKVRRKAGHLLGRLTSFRYWYGIAAVTASACLYVAILMVIRARFPHLGNFIKLPGLIGGILLGMLTGAAAETILAWWSESKRRARIDKQIRARIAAGERDFSKVEDFVRRQNSTPSSDYRETEGLVRERLQRYLEDESEMQREAEDEIMRYLEPMPRHAKRLLNRLRLLLFIAHERGMFGGKPNLTARHIGKWAVLGERWPELSQAVCVNPEVMLWLEDHDQHDMWVKSLAPAYANDDALRRFCVSSPGVKLNPVIKRIVEFAHS